MDFYEVNFTKTFNRDLNKIQDYISDEIGNPESAKRIVDSIMTKGYSLKLFPKALPIRIHTRNMDLRFTFVRRYTIVYFVDQKNRTVHLYRVLYSHQNILALFK